MIPEIVGERSIGIEPTRTALAAVIVSVNFQRSDGDEKKGEVSCVSSLKAGLSSAAAGAKEVSRNLVVVFCPNSDDY
jgi:hypothetical protein